MAPAADVRTMTTVLLVRHGETPWNRDRRLQGWAPVPLADRGREQARALGTVLTERYAVDTITTSDLARARETADLVADAVGGSVTEDPGWRERDFGVLQGLTFDALDERHRAYSLSHAGEAAVGRRPERGESLTDARERVLDAWDRTLSTSGPDETHLVVTHGGPIHLVLGHLLGRPVVESVLEADQDNCAVNEVRVGDGPPEVVLENETAMWRRATPDGS